MQGGTKLVVIDPTFTTVASMADKWIPIRPGTDTLLKFALMNIVLQQNAHDETYLKNFTVAPFLVRDDNGLFLRTSDVDEAIRPEDAEIMVLQNGSALPLSQASEPMLEGSLQVGEINCSTAFTLLKDEISQYDLAKVSELTEISEEDIKELADICMDTPVFHYEGYGPQAYRNGAATTKAGLTLCALLGNLGRPGASYGPFWAQFAAWNPAYAQPLEPSTSPLLPSCDIPYLVKEGGHSGKKIPLKMLWVYVANPLSTCADTNQWLDVVIPEMECVVVADSMMTDTARYADYVLPITQWFEMDDIPCEGQTASIHYSEKAIEPLYECKPDFEIIKGVADKLGLGDYFFESSQEILEAVLDCDECRSAGITLEAIKEKKQIRFIDGDAETDPHIAWKDGNFQTPTGRLEFYCENPFFFRESVKQIEESDLQFERLPRWRPPAEAWHENELFQQYPLVCMSERPRYRVHSQWYNTPLLLELDSEPTVKINPKDADARGIENGCHVECYNDRGHVVAKAVLSEGVRPGTLVYPKNWQMSQHRAGSWSELSSTDFDPFTVNGDFMDLLCEIRVWEGEQK